MKITSLKEFHQHIFFLKGGPHTEPHSRLFSQTRRNLVMDHWTFGVKTQPFTLAHKLAAGYLRNDLRSSYSGSTVRVLF